MFNMFLIIPIIQAYIYFVVDKKRLILQYNVHRISIDSTSYDFSSRKMVKFIVWLRLANNTFDSRMNGPLLSVPKMII